MRPDHLTRCLESLLGQTVPITNIYVGVRSDDHLSRDLLDLFVDRGPITCVTAEGVGVVGSMSSCLAYCKGDLIGLVDDDVELPRDWLERVKTHLDNYPLAIAAGGRDLLMDHPEMRRTEKTTLEVGRFYWYGKVGGDHHRGGGTSRRVDVLRGSNLLLRGDFLRQHGFDRRLAGKGAQVHWELTLALQAHQAKRHMIYDPEITIIHHVAPRVDSDTLHRGRFESQATTDVAFNETSIALRHARGFQRLAMMVWQLAVGTSITPGLMRLVPSLFKRGTNVFSKYSATMRGRFKAILTFFIPTG